MGDTWLTTTTAPVPRAPSPSDREQLLAGRTHPVPGLAQRSPRPAAGSRGPIATWSTPRRGRRRAGGRRTRRSRPRPTARRSRPAGRCPVPRPCPRARWSGLEITRVAPATTGPTLAGLGRPPFGQRRVDPAEQEPLGVARWTLRGGPGSTSVEHSDRRTASVHQDAIALRAGGELVGWEVADPLHLHGRQGQVAPVAPVADQLGRAHSPEVGPQHLVPLGQVGGKAGGQPVADGGLGGDGRIDSRLRLGDGGGQPPASASRAAAGGPVLPSRLSSGSCSSRRTSSSSSRRGLSLGQLVDLVVHGLEVPRRRDRAGLHPLLDLVAALGRGGDVLLEAALPPGQVVHQGLDLGHASAPARPGAARTSASAARSGSASFRRRSWSRVVSCSWTCIRVSNGSAITDPLAGVPGVRSAGPVEARTSLRADARPPASASSATARAAVPTEPGHLLALARTRVPAAGPGPTAGSAGRGGRDPGPPRGRPRWTSVGVRPRVDHGQAGLLPHSRRAAAARCLAGLEVPARLQPPVEPAVAVQDHAAAARPRWRTP